jgi:hypothetical protein
VGAGWNGIALDLAGARSRPLSGEGQNQNVLAASIGRRF